MTATPPISDPPPGSSSLSVSSAEAAANWLSSAKSETVADSQVSARAAVSHDFDLNPLCVDGNPGGIYVTKPLGFMLMLSLGEI